MPDNNNRSRGQTGKNANLNITARNGNVEDYDLSEIMLKTSNAVDNLVGKVNELTKALGNVGKTSEKSFDVKPIERYFREYDKRNFTSQIRKEYDESLKLVDALKKQNDEAERFTKIARTKSAGVLGRRYKEINEEGGLRDRNTAKIKSIESRAIGNTGQYKAVGGEVNKKTGHVYTPGETLSKELSATVSDEYKGLLKQQTSFEDESLNIQEKFGEANVSATTMALDGVKKIVGDVLNAIKQDFEKGVSNFHSFYESNFTEIAGRTNTGGNRSDTREIFKQTQDLAKEYGSALNYNNDVLPQVMALTKQGLTGSDLYERSVLAALDNKILPWLDETNSTWLDVSRLMGEGNAARYKNMQLTMQDNKMGNRLLQTGVIDKLIADIYPVLESIDYNTVDRSTISEEMLALMETYKSKGFSDQEAYQAAKNAYDISGNLYGALTSGDVSKIVQAQNQMKYGLGEGALKTANYFTEMMGRAADDVGASAISSAYNAGQYLRDNRATVENARGSQLDVNTYYKNYAELVAGTSNTDLYDKQKDNVDQFSTATKIFKNAVENLGSKLGLLESGMVGGQLLGSAGRGLALSIGAFAGKKLLNHFLPGLGSGGGGIANLLSQLGGKGGGVSNLLSNLGGEGGSMLSNAGGAIKNIAGAAKPLVGDIGKGLIKGGIKAGGASSATAALAGVAGLAAGAIMMGKDSIEAGKKADEWGASKSSAKIAGALLGSEETPSVKNTAKQMAKGAAIGAGIGSFIPGVGTVIGGAVGAGVGALSSVISGKDFANWLDKQKSKRAENKAYKKELKLAEASNKGSKGVVSDILKSVQNIEKFFDDKENDANKSKLGISAVSKGLTSKNAFNVLKSSNAGAIASLLGFSEEDNGLGNLLGIASMNPFGMIAKNLMGKNADDINSESVAEKTLTYGESQIIETIKEIGSNIVKSVNAINPTKNDIDYANGLYRAINKEKDQSSMVTLISDSPTNSITA